MSSAEDRVCPGSSPASAPAPSRAVTYFSLRASDRLLTHVRQAAASRLSLGRTPPGPRLENTIRSAFFSRCQLPRPNCQRTKRADDTISQDDDAGSRPVMDRGSLRLPALPCAKHRAIRLPKRASTHDRDCHEPSSGNRFQAHSDRPQDSRKISGRPGGRQAPGKSRRKTPGSTDFYEGITGACPLRFHGVSGSAWRCSSSAQAAAV